jgi:hypothetical protein
MYEFSAHIILWFMLTRQSVASRSKQIVKTFFTISGSNQKQKVDLLVLLTLNSISSPSSCLIVCVVFLQNLSCFSMSVSILYRILWPVTGNTRGVSALKHLCITWTVLLWILSLPPTCCAFISAEKLELLRAIQK